MTEVKIVLPTGALGSSAGEDFLCTAMRIIGVGFAEPGEWSAKYGCDFENEVFLMKPYCWCESPACPWCAGCGDFEDACIACSAHPHDSGCFKDVTYARREAWKASHPKAPFDEQMNAGRRINIDERRRRGLPLEPYQWLCDCGAEDEMRTDRDVRGCDAHLGTGVFARFNGRAPNFWFKPSNFKLNWYKYIGRDMEVDGDLPADFLERIFATHPTGMTLDEAISETGRQEEETAESFRRMMASLSDGLAQDAAEDGSREAERSEGTAKRTHP